MALGTTRGATAGRPSGVCATAAAIFSMALFVVKGREGGREGGKEGGREGRLVGWERSERSLGEVKGRGRVESKGEEDKARLVISFTCASARKSNSFVRARSSSQKTR